MFGRVLAHKACKSSHTRMVWEGIVVVSCGFDVKQTFMQRSLLPGHANGRTHHTCYA